MHAPTPTRTPALRTAAVLAATVGTLLLLPAAGALAAAPTHCGVDLSAPAVRKAIAQLPPYRFPGGQVAQWSTHDVGGDYDPCIRVSGVDVGLQRSTGGSPRQLLLFAHGRYVGTAAQRAYPFTAVDPVHSTATTVVADFRWLEVGDSDADPQGHSTVRFTWDGTRVVRTGALPPAPVGGGALLTAGELHLAWTSGGAGVRPTQFAPCTGSYPAEAHRVTGYSREFASTQGGRPGTSVVEDVERYSSPADAAAAVSGYADAAAACPTTTEGTVTTTYEVLARSPLLVRGTRTDSAAPAPVAPTYYAFPRVGGLLAEVVTGNSHGDLGTAAAQHTAQQARAHLVGQP